MSEPLMTTMEFLYLFSQAGGGGGNKVPALTVFNIHNVFNMEVNTNKLYVFILKLIQHQLKENICLRIGFLCFPPPLIIMLYYCDNCWYMLVTCRERDMTMQDA